MMQHKLAGNLLFTNCPSHDLSSLLFSCLWAWYWNMNKVVYLTGLSKNGQKVRARSDDLNTSLLALCISWIELEKTQVGTGLEPNVLGWDFGNSSSIYFDTLWFCISKSLQIVPKSPQNIFWTFLQPTSYMVFLDYIPDLTISLHCFSPKSESL